MLVSLFFVWVANRQRAFVDVATFVTGKVIYFGTA